MAEAPEKLLEGTRLLDESTASSSENETEEDSADHEGSVRAILDASESPAKACRTEDMDWSDNLSGVEALISASDTGKICDSTELKLTPVDEPAGFVSTELVQTDPRTDMHQAIPTEGPGMEDRSEIEPVTQTFKGRTGDASGDVAGTGSSLPDEGPDQHTDSLQTSVTQTSQGRTDSASIEDRAKAYVKKKKDEQTAAIKLSLGDKALTYDAINAANRRKMAAPYLQSEAGHKDEGFGNGGDFLSSSDGRVSKAILHVNLLRKTTVSYSFDPQRKVCMQCHVRGPHPVLGKALGDSRREAVREVILLGDQALPPLLPSSSELNCMSFVRLEFGGLHQLVSILLDLLEGRKLCPGSLILLFSVTHIAQVGIAGYIEDLVSARKRLKEKLGDSIYVSAAPPLLLCGLDREESIRDIFDLQEWLVGAVPEELHFKSANYEALCAIMENGDGGAQPEYRARVRLPVSLSGALAQKIWCTGGSASLPCATAPTTEEQEKLVMESLIGEIKSKLAINLDELPVTSRKVEEAASKCPGNFLVVGSSNARRLVAALAAKGIPVGSVLSNSWRATKQSVVEMAEHVRQELAAGSYTAVIFQLLDNNLYFACTEEGGLIPAARDNDGKYHVEGNLTVADKAALVAVMKLCGPLWEAAAGKHMVILSPLPRYVKEGCCGEYDHMPNRREADFYQTLKLELAACSKHLKDYLFNAGLRYGRVMDPMRNLRGLVVDEIWGRDPIHPKEEIYSLLADGIMDVEKTCGNRQQKRKASDWVRDGSGNDGRERHARGGNESRGQGSRHGASSHHVSGPSDNSGSRGKSGGEGRWVPRGGRGWGGGDRGGRGERGGHGGRGGRYPYRGKY